MQSATTVPLSQEELIELDTFLLSDACGDETLSVDEAHGFLTALAVSPDGEEAADWQRGVWGEPEFADAAEAERLGGLLQRLRGEIETNLAAGRRFEPLVVEVEEDGESVESYEGWCFGFMLGVAQQQPEWNELPREVQELMAPMAQLALLADEEEEPEMDDDEYASWVELVPGAVMGLYGFWHRG